MINIYLLNFKVYFIVFFFADLLLCYCAVIGNNFELFSMAENILK